jgi:hypothetical protein
MLGFAVLFLSAYIVYLHARIVRKGLTQAENPVFVYEKPELSRALQHVADRVDRWREEGRLSREEHEKLTFLIQEDGAAERAVKEKKK